MHFFDAFRVKVFQSVLLYILLFNLLFRAQHCLNFEKMSFMFLCDMNDFPTAIFS